MDAVHFQTAPVFAVNDVAPKSVSVDAALTLPSARYGYEARVIFEEQTVACAAGEVLPSLKRAKQSAALLLLQKLREESTAVQDA